MVIINSDYYSIAHFLIWSVYESALATCDASVQQAVLTASPWECLSLMNASLFLGTGEVLSYDVAAVLTGMQKSPTMMLRTLMTESGATRGTAASAHPSRSLVRVCYLVLHSLLSRITLFANHITHRQSLFLSLPPRAQRSTSRRILHT